MAALTNQDSKTCNLGNRADDCQPGRLGPAFSSQCTGTVSLSSPPLTSITMRLSPHRQSDQGLGPGGFGAGFCTWFKTA